MGICQMFKKMRFKIVNAMYSSNATMSTRRVKSTHSISHSHKRTRNASPKDMIVLTTLTLQIHLPKLELAWVEMKAHCLALMMGPKFNKRS